nr:hypothetical protein [Gammaproteobacteria bacterium]
TNQFYPLGDCFDGPLARLFFVNTPLWCGRHALPGKQLTSNCYSPTALWNFIFLLVSIGNLLVIDLVWKL